MLPKLLDFLPIVKKLDAETKELGLRFIGRLQQEQDQKAFLREALKRALTVPTTPKTISVKVDEHD